MARGSPAAAAAVAGASSTPSPSARRSALPGPSSPRSVSPSQPRPGPSSPRLALTMKRARKSSGAMVSTFPAMCRGPQGWADMPHDLLHRIVPLFTLASDLLAFIRTCRSWHAAAFSCPPASAFTFPPLFLIPYTCLSKCRWHLKDPANKAFSLRLSMPLKTPIRLYFVGCSFGHFIFFYNNRMLLIDVLTGIKIKPPRMPPTRNHTILYGALTAPLMATTNSHLLVCTKGSLLLWQVGSSHWSELPLVDDQEEITQIVAFNGHIFAMDTSRSLFRVHLRSHRLRLKVVPTANWSFGISSLCARPWLVPCGDTLLLVEYAASDWRPQSAKFRAYRLDRSTVPARWVELDTLEGCAVFVCLNRSCQAFCCVSPERWGGQSNCIYLATKAPMRLAAFRLGQKLGREDTDFVKSEEDEWGATPFDQLEPLWVLPSMIYRAGQSMS